MQNPLPYHNLYVGIIDILQEVFFENGYTDKVLERTFKKNKQWGSRDRGFVAETVYDCVRWKRLINYASGDALGRKDGWRFVGSWFIMNGMELPKFKEFSNLKKHEILKRYNEGMQIPVIRYSVTDDLWELGEKELGTKWPEVLGAMNQPAPAILRVNTIKTTKKELQKELAKNKIESESIKGYPDALMITEKANLFTTEAFANGWFEMQDASSQLVAPFVNPNDKMRIADSCAGAGGKSLHLATLMENKGSIVSMDLYAWKLKELKKRAKRDGIFTIQTKVIESNKTIKRQEKSFDKVLIDAPCSGSGILKRNPDAKWKINTEFVERVKKTQREILHLHQRMVKNGGELIYATCSVFPSENQGQVDEFLKEFPEFTKIDEKVILPNETGFDGFYMAKLKRD